MRRCFLLLPLIGYAAVVPAAGPGDLALSPDAAAPPLAVDTQNASAPAAGTPVEEESMMEQGRQGVRAITEGVARTVDGWFGDIPFEEGGKVSGSVRFDFLARQDEGLENNFRFRVRVDLPNVKRLGYIFIGQDNEQEEVTDQPETFRRQHQLLTESRRDDQSFFAGVGYALREFLEFRAGFRGGVDDIYAQARYKKLWRFSDRDVFGLRETIFWRSDDGFGSTLALNYDHAYSPSWSFRWQAVGTISEETSGLRWGNSFGLFKAYPNLRESALEVLVNGETDRRVGVSEYGVRATWRQPIHRDWTFIELSVGHFWPQDDDDPERRRSWAAGVMVEALF